MRIGIDATPLPTQPVGAGNYIIQLIGALERLESVHEFIIFHQKGGRAWFSDLERPGFRFILLPDRRPAFRLVWEQFAFPILVRKFRLNVLHSLHYTMPFIKPCPAVVSFHDMTFFLYPELHTRSKRLFFPLAMRASVKRADMLVVPSDSTRRDALRLLKIAPEKVLTVPLGVNDNFRPQKDERLLLEIRRKYDLPDRFILYVGLIEPRKNLPSLINAYDCLRKRGIDLPVVIAGRRGWQVEEVTRMVEALHLTAHIHFSGYIEPQDLPMVYNLADLFVYPSLYEGFGLPVLEAMACGTPVVTSAISSMPEVVGDAGLLVPPREIEPLANAMHSLLVDRALREQLSERGLERAAHFTWERTAAEMLNVYQTVGS
jgi:glycosyltransferase involved in cell wall biosynthesis